MPSFVPRGTKCLTKNLTKNSTSRLTTGAEYDTILTMKTKTNTVGIRLDDTSIERLDALAQRIGKTRSATLRRLLMFVDKECGVTGEQSAFVRWSKRIDAMPLF